MQPTDIPADIPKWHHCARLALTLWLIGLVVAALVLTRNWPLVNDGALQHYISFLTDHGLAPYRQIADMNLPGSLMIDWSVIHTLGPGAHAWRVFDALVMLLASAAILLISRRHQSFNDRFAGIVAASLFWLLHARDGMGQTGQRDLIEAALLLTLLAAAFHAMRSGKGWPLAVAALCAGITVTIKPDSIVLSVIVLTLAVRKSSQPTRSLTLVALAFLVPLAAATAFLLHHHALHAFWLSLIEVTPFYASLGRQPFPELLRDCLSTPMRVLLALAVLLATLNHPRWTQEKTILALATAWGLASFFLQGKGYLYHRYPTLGFLLVWAAIECTDALRSSPRLRILGAAGLLYASLVIAPLSLIRAARATWKDSLLTALQIDLTHLGGASLAHNIQCVDSISGCNVVLYRMHLPEETGMLSDFLLFGSPDQPLDNQAPVQSAVRRARAIFWQQINTRPPRVFVITGWLHPAGLDHYQKLALWPDFATFLAEHYTLAEQRDFAPGQNGPLSYRIYLLR